MTITTFIMSQTFCNQGKNEIRPISILYNGHDGRMYKNALQYLVKRTQFLSKIDRAIRETENHSMNKITRAYVIDILQ